MSSSIGDWGPIPMLCSIPQVDSVPESATRGEWHLLDPLSRLANRSARRRVPKAPPEVGLTDMAITSGT